MLALCRNQCANRGHCSRAGEQGDREARVTIRTKENRGAQRVGLKETMEALKPDRADHPSKWDKPKIEHCKIKTCTDRAALETDPSSQVFLMIFQLLFPQSAIPQRSREGTQVE